ncbi:MAG: hypothetical protein ABIF92_03225 [archaeon]
MKKLLLIMCVLLTVFAAGCISEPTSQSGAGVAKGDAPAVAPEEIVVPAVASDDCSGYEEDICALFACSVDSCSCDETEGDPVIFVGENEIQDKDAALLRVRELLDTGGFTYASSSAKKLNDRFFNVFVYDENGEEFVYTVAKDGTIFLTICEV